MEDLNQIQVDWTLVTASRELLSIANKHPNVTYRDAIKFTREIYPDRMSNSAIGRNKKNKLEKLRDKVQQEALGRTRSEKREVLPEQVITDRIKIIEKLLDQ